MDALFIDQTNNAEMSKQVLFMKDIHTKATIVAIWLGDDYPEARRVVEFITTVAQR